MVARGRGARVPLAGEAGVGGRAGMKKEGIVTAEEMRAMYSVIFGIWPGSVARKGSISWPRAPPNGFARLASAVAETRPAGVNQRSEYRVGAESTNGCANPMRIWPSMTTGNWVC